MATPTTADARAVANYLLAKADVEQLRLDPLKLLKLVYISHGWTMGLRGVPLITQQVLAWPHGPVIPDVYHAFKRFGYTPIEGRAVYYDYEAGTWKDYPPTLDPDSKEIVDRVWDAYKGFTGPQLSTLTHQAGTPWALVTEGLQPNQIRDVPIPNEIIRSHYRQLALKNKQAQASAAGSPSAGSTD